MSVHIELSASSTGFAEDKDLARDLREREILPALERSDRVVLDFSRVNYATQSYIHALIGEPLKKYGEDALESLEFKGCSPQLKSLITLVVDYSLGGFSETQPSAKSTAR
jgi:hypothetical protein